MDTLLYYIISAAVASNNTVNNNTLPEDKTANISDNLADIGGFISNIPEILGVKDILDQLENPSQAWDSLTAAVTTFAEEATDTYYDTYNDSYNNILQALSGGNVEGDTPWYIETAATVGGAVSGGISVVADTIETAGRAAASALENMRETLDMLAESDENGAYIASILSRGLDMFMGTQGYVNGVDETSFGSYQEQSWSKSGGFLDTFLNNKSNRYKINFITNTPLNSGDQMESLYGNMILGVPPLFNHISDPRSDGNVNSFIKDAKFLSLTPGIPRFNGSDFLNTKSSDALSQTPDGDSMLEFLLKNGYDSDSFYKDKRYYSFQPEYDLYFSYLETMLNTVYIKLGLATSENADNEFNLFSFFNISGSSSSIKSELMSKYQSSIAFFVNPSGALSESINNSETSFGQELQGTYEQFADENQRINYFTGMGNNRSAVSGLAGAGRTTLMTANIIKNSLSYISDSLSNTISGFQQGQGLSKIAYGLIGLTNDVLTLTSTQDMGTVIASFANTSGARAVYPELWSSGSYSQVVNINFEFMSPYGDPLSIFQYVYVPFFSLLAFALPRQSGTNQFVSPLFVRADIPGYFTIDFGLITDLTWNLGGNSNIWTKDGLPRSISGSFSIANLFPFLAGTKYISALSSNPQYTSFLDRFAGLHAVYQTDSTTNLNDFFKQMLNRVSGINSSNILTNGLWNRYNRISKQGHTNYATTTKGNRDTLRGSQIPWFRSAS